MSGPRHPVRPRTPLRSALLWVPVVLAIAGCVSVAPGSSASVAGDRVHRQAQAALARWADAVGGTKKQGVVFVGELTSQVGDWEPSLGDNDKIALMSGQLRPTASLPTQQPPAGEVRWPDGSSSMVELLSADRALADVVRAAESCDGCVPLEVTAARLTSGSTQTSRGPASAPLWEFSLKGTAVKVARVAVADPIAVVPPPWDPNDPPEGISISSARGDAGAAQLTVSFVGAPTTGDQPCGADYTAEAVESPLAVVVIVVEHQHPTIGACSAVGAPRTAEVHLASPLGDRAVLEVTQGLPVSVLAP